MLRPVISPCRSSVFFTPSLHFRSVCGDVRPCRRGGGCSVCTYEVCGPGSNRRACEPGFGIGLNTLRCSTTSFSHDSRATCFSLREASVPGGDAECVFNRIVTFFGVWRPHQRRGVDLAAALARGHLQNRKDLARNEHGRISERWQVGPIATVSADCQTEPGRAGHTWQHRFLGWRVVAAATARAGYATTRTAHELHAESATHGAADANVCSAASISLRWFFGRAQWREGGSIAAAARCERGRADASPAAASSWRAPNSAPDGESGAGTLAQRRKSTDGLREACGAEGDGRVQCAGPPSGGQRGRRQQ